MPIITLTSDWGTKDHYLAAVKGTILGQLPDAVIIDISHDITPFNLKQASFIIKNSYPHFPEGSIHIIALNTVETTDSPHTVVFHKGQYFIGADSGIFSMIFDSFPEKMIELDIPQDTGLFTFTTRDRFIKAALHIAQGKDLKELGNVRKDWFQQLLFQPVISEDIIKGIVIYVDNYENVITNITEKIFREVGKGRKFSIECRGHQITKISKSYLDVNPSEKLALFGSTGHLEIALNQGNASSLLGLYLDDPVSVRFI